MALTYTLEPWQAELYLDTFQLYEPVRNANKDVIGLRLSSEDVHPGFFHATDNFDESKGGRTGVQFKQNNYQTSDRGECHMDVPIRAKHVLKWTLRDGREEWTPVLGAGKIRMILKHQRFNLGTAYTPDNIITE